MGSKKAALPYLKGLETLNTPALLGGDRRDGETLFDPDASVQLRPDEWDRLWQHDKAELPQLYRALHACGAEAAKPGHARPPISDGALARAVALSRNNREIGTDHWTLLELKALPDVAIASLALTCETDRRSAHHSAAVSHKSQMFVAQGRWRRQTHRASVLAACLVEKLPC